MNLRVALLLHSHSQMRLEWQVNADVIHRATCHVASIARSDQKYDLQATPGPGQLPPGAMTTPGGENRRSRGASQWLLSRQQPRMIAAHKSSQDGRGKKLWGLRGSHASPAPPGTSIGLVFRRSVRPCLARSYTALCTADVYVGVWFFTAHAAARLLVTSQQSSKILSHRITHPSCDGGGGC